MTSLTRTLLTAIFLALFSQTAWGVSLEWQLKTKIDCDRIKHYSDEAFFNIDANRKDIWELKAKIIEKQNGKHTAGQSETIKMWESTISDALDDLEKWATIYNAFCK